MNEYGDRLKHPKWQRKRLEIFNRDDFKCTHCGEDDKTLVVHHRKYVNKKYPWDYDNEDLTTLCQDCHEKYHSEIFTVEKIFKVIRDNQDQEVPEALFMKEADLLHYYFRTTIFKLIDRGYLEVKSQSFNPATKENKVCFRILKSLGRF